jgi:hypothetical protein
MQNSNTKLEVSFPKSSEDKKLQLVGINGSIFAIVFANLESDGPINLHCEDWSLILLAPIKSKTDIVVSGINVISLNDIQSAQGTTSVRASNLLVKFTSAINYSEKVHEIGEAGQYQFNDDPSSFLTYFKLFNSVINNVRNVEPSQEAFLEARQKFIMCLCALAAKIEGKTDLNIKQVLEIWKIPYLEGPDIT